jgi:hypothetical protein
LLDKTLIQEAIAWWRHGVTASRRHGGLIAYDINVAGSNSAHGIPVNLSMSM